VIWVQYAVFGLAVGAVFALLAAGIVLTYRASGVLNFAHASTGVAAAYVNFELLERCPWMPVGVALVLSMLFGAGLGVAAQRVVFAPVAASSQIVKLLVSSAWRSRRWTRPRCGGARCSPWRTASASAAPRCRTSAWR
jgi:branched-subunit amino acid ABC-type transport system permease component